MSGINHQALAYQIFTVGHSNQPVEDFIDLLIDKNIEVLVDIRSSPFSRYAAQFDKKALEASIKAAGLMYLFLGKELGGRPQPVEYYDVEGHVNYRLVAESAPFVEGIARLEKGVKDYKVALMCSEENPVDCHRRLLVGRVLVANGLEVIHIRGGGELEPELAFTSNNDQAGNETDQLSLPGFDREEPAWRSRRSILHKRSSDSSSNRYQ